MIAIMMYMEHLTFFYDSQADDESSASAPNCMTAVNSGTACLWLHCIEKALEGHEYATISDRGCVNGA